jgi:hypothetical protein
MKNTGVVTDIYDNIDILIFNSTQTSFFEGTIDFPTIEPYYLPHHTTPHHTRK